MTPPYVCVVTIRGGVLIYSGQSYSLAAECLEPGTCYGRGFTPEEASVEARMRAGWFLERRAA